MLDRERISVATLVPAMLQACLVAVDDVADRRYDHLRSIYYGASPIAEATLRRAIEAFGCGFVQSYGMTEATQALTFLTADDHRLALDAPAGAAAVGGPAGRRHDAAAGRRADSARRREGPARSWHVARS